MSRARPTMRLFWLFLSLAIAIDIAAGLAAANAQNTDAGPVTGVIDGVQFQDDRYYVSGWACQEGQRGSIDVHIYAGHAPGNKFAGDKFVTAGTANLPNEPAVDRECHDANGGKHRFQIPLPNQLLRTFQNKQLYAHGIAIAGNVENSVIQASGIYKLPMPKWPPDPPTPNFLNGPAVAVFDTRKDSCEQIDIPDAPARAFRDYKGTIHLIASHYVTRAGLGPTLETIKHNCQIVYNSAHDGNVADFNDYTWLTAFYSVDGKQIVGLGHMEYHGWEHPGMCAQTQGAACWYNVDTFNLSTDGGYHFVRLKAPANYLVSLPAKYEPNQGPQGYSVDTGIVKVGPWFYATVYSWAWPPNCGDGRGQRRCLVPDATCPLRTANILDPSSWRGWDGKDFTVTFADPYRAPVANPAAHVCVPVPYLDYASGVNYHPASHLFIATLWNQHDTLWGPQGVYFTTSSDFIHWTKPQLALTLNKMLRRDPEGSWSYAYFSLIDPKSEDSSFVTITDTPYLYYTRSDDNHGPYQRVLFRQKINLNWLTKAQVKASIPSSASIEGTHQIVSQATGLCFNIKGNTNNNGEAIIPWPCGGSTNMQFNFVDQGGGFYSIHTLNGTQALCLNISTAASSPGDGKKFGGAGNLIQWSCGGSSLSDNELFKLVDLAGGRQQIRVKNSGLCLEDPGSGGTIRQNVCSSSPNQTFTLTE